MITVNINKEEKKEIDLINKAIQKIDGETDINKVLNLMKKEFKIFEEQKQKELLTKLIHIAMIVKKV